MATSSDQQAGHLLMEMECYFPTNPDLNKTKCGHFRSDKVKCQHCSSRHSCAAHLRSRGDCNCPSGSSCTKCNIYQKDSLHERFCQICYIINLIHRDKLSPAEYESIFSVKKYSSDDGKVLMMTIKEMIKTLARSSKQDYSLIVAYFRDEMKAFHPTIKRVSTVRGGRPIRVVTGQRPTGRPFMSMDDVVIKTGRKKHMKTPPPYCSLEPVTAVAVTLDEPYVFTDEQLERINYVETQAGACFAGL